MPGASLKRRDDLETVVVYQNLRGARAEWAVEADQPAVRPQREAAVHVEGRRG